MKYLIMLAVVVAVATAAPSGKSAGTYPSASIQGISYVQTPSVATYAQPLVHVSAAYSSGYVDKVDDEDDGLLLSGYRKKSSDSDEDDDRRKGGDDDDDKRKGGKDDDDDEGSNERGKGKGKESEDDDDHKKQDKGSGERSGHKGHGKGGDDDGELKGSGQDDDDNKKYSLSPDTLLSSAPLWGSTAGLISTGGVRTGVPATKQVHTYASTAPIIGTASGSGILGVRPIAVPSVSGQTTWTTSGQNIAWPSAPAAVPAVSTQTMYGTYQPAISMPLPAQSKYETQRTSIAWPGASGQLMSTAHVQPALHPLPSTVYGARPTVQKHASLLQPVSWSGAMKQESVPATHMFGGYSGAIPLPHSTRAQLTAAPHSRDTLTSYNEQIHGAKTHPEAGTMLKLSPVAASLNIAPTGPHQKSGYTGRITRY